MPDLSPVITHTFSHEDFQLGAPNPAHPLWALSIAEPLGLVGRNVAPCTLCELTPLHPASYHKSSNYEDEVIKLLIIWDNGVEAPEREGRRSMVASNPVRGCGVLRCAPCETPVAGPGSGAARL